MRRGLQESKSDQSRRPASPRVRLILTTLVYAAILHYTYAYLISPQFTYLGLSYRPPTATATITSVLLTVVVALTLPSQARAVSDFFVWALFLLAVAPSILIAQYAQILTPDQALQLALALTGSYLGFNWLTNSLPTSSRIAIGVPRHIFITCAVAVSIVTYVGILSQGGSSLSLVGLMEVRDVRSSYKAIVAGAPLIGYAIQFQTAVINPVLMSIGAAHRRMLPLLCGILGQVLIYSATGYKLTILSPIFVIALSLAIQYRRKLGGLALSVAVTGAMFASVLGDAMLGSRFLVTVFVNRLIAAPGVLTSAYFSVFDGQPKYMWSYSFMGAFVQSPYVLTPGYHVGRTFQGVDSQANANPLADGYANLGWPGSLLELAFLALLLGALNWSSKGIPLVITAPSSLVAAVGLTNNSALSAVLTGGVGGLILVFALWPRVDRPQNSFTSAPVGARPLDRARNPGARPVQPARNQRRSARQDKSHAAR